MRNSHPYFKLDILLQKKSSCRNEFRIGKAIFSLVCLFIVFFVRTPHLSGQAMDTVRFWQLRDTVLKAFNEGRFVDCLPFLEKTEKLFVGNEEKHPRLYGRFLFHKGRVLSNIGQYIDAEPLLKNAIEILKIAEGENSVKIGDVYNALGNCYMRMYNFEGMVNNFENAHTTYIAALGPEDPYTVGPFMNLGMAYSLWGKFDEAEKYYQKAIGFFLAQDSLDHFSIGKGYGNLGFTMFNKGEFKKAIKYTKMALEHFEEVLPPEHYFFGTIYSNLARNYSKMGNMNLVESYMGQSINLYENAFGEQSLPALRQRIQFGVLCLEGQEIEKAAEIMESAIPLFESATHEGDENLAHFYEDLSKLYGLEKDYKRSIFYLTKANDIYLSNNKNEPTPNVFVVRCQLGRDYFHLNELEKAEAIFLEIVNDKKNNPYKRTLSYAYDFLGKIYAKYGDYEKASEYADLALKADGVISDDGQFTPEAKLDFSVLGLIILKAEYESNLYPIGSKNWLNQEKYFDYAINTIESIRKNMTQQEVREFEVHQQFLDVYENAFYFYKDAFNANQKKGYLEKALFSIEKNKSEKLSRAFRANKIQVTVPDSILEKETSLKTSITSLDKLIYEEKESEKERHNSKLEIMQKEIFAKKEELRDFYISLRNEYPDYFNLYQQRKNISLSDLTENVLNDSCAIIEYLHTDSFLYAMIIDAEYSKIIQIKKNFPLDSLIRQLQQATYTCHLTDCTEAEKQKEINDLNKTAHQLYQLIFQPIEQAVDLPEKLIIIPDGVLGYVPFEMLLKELPAENAAYSTYPYLLKDYQISYCYSATLLHEMQQMEKGKAKKDFLAFAPSFGDKESIAATNRSITDIRAELGALRYNVPEVTALQALMGGDIFTGAAATEDAFNQHAPNYRILHLATHGKANDQVGDYAYLAFTEVDDSLENELLYNRDLYNLRLNADLVVLSACETGIGELQRGEGIISLARGFSYAGARSIVTTLWSINDATTKELMEGFYSNIIAGMTKDAALRKAKLEYIESHPNDLVHPFYWAAFVPIGDMSPVELGNGNWWMWAIGSILFFGVFYIFRKRK